jgi:hypothetical protein
MSEWKMDAQDLLESIGIYADKIRSAETEEEFHEAVKGLSFCLLATLPALPAKEEK